MIGLIICTGLLASHIVILNCNLFIYSETFIDTVVTCYNRYLLVNLMMNSMYSHQGRSQG